MCKSFYLSKSFISPSENPWILFLSVDESEGAATGEDNSESDELYTLAVERGKAVESVAVKLDQIRQIGDRIAQHPGKFSFFKSQTFSFSGLVRTSVTIV